MILSSNISGFLHDVIQVGVEDEGFVPLFNSKGEASLLIWEGAPGEGLRLTLRDHVLPPGGDPVEGIHERIIVGQAVGEAAGIECSGEADAAAGDGGGAAEIELDRVVELVGVDPVDLGDVEVAVC